MNIIQQIIDFIMGLLGQGAANAAKSIAEGQSGSKPEKQKSSPKGAISGLDEIEGAENVRVVSGEVKESRDGASMIEDEDDGSLLWINEVDLDVPRDSWEDVWGPLDGPDDDSLAKFFMHELAFNMEMTSDAYSAEKKLEAFGYADAGEFFKVRASVLKHFATPHGPNLGDGVLDSQRVMSASMKGHSMSHQANMQASMQADPSLVEPIEGVTIERYAELAAQAVGMSPDAWAAHLAGAGLDLARWDVVAEGWGNRMRDDTTHTLVMLYGKAFQSAGTGQFGAQSQASAATNYDGTAAGGPEPMSLERCCEIQGAIQAWSNTGQDVNAMLNQTFQMNAAEQAAAHTWWLSQLTADMARFPVYNELVAKYEAQYSANAPAAPDSDLDF
ncbi:MAG: hypothetical protein R3F61_34155 [Myxococcota bacterium]